MFNFIKNIFAKKRVRTDKMATPPVSRGRISRPEKETLVREGTQWAMREYGKTFEILRDYDRS